MSRLASSWLVMLGLVASFFWINHAYGVVYDIESMRLMHTVPECNNTWMYGEDFTSTWCTGDDRSEIARKSKMEKEVNRLLRLAKDPAKARIYIAYFSFSNQAVFDRLCEMGKEGFKIEGFFDSSYNAAGKLPVRLKKECQGPTRGNVVVHFLGHKKLADNPRDPPLVWRLHHNKFLLVDPGEDDKPVQVNFSSGNLSNFGLSLHLDHWVMATASKASNLWAHHACVVNALRVAIDPDGNGRDAKHDDPQLYRATLDDCQWDEQTGVYWPEDALEYEGISPIFSPNPENQVYKTLVGLIRDVKRGGTIVGAIQHFRHQGIADALINRAKNGVQVTLIMDNDIVSGQSEVPGVGKFYEKNLAPGSGSKIKVKFMPTNAEEWQMMHHKFLVLKQPDGEGRVFSGAGHFTYSAMVKNYENFYVTSNEGLVADYDGMFKWMDKHSMSAELIQDLWGMF